MKLMPTIPRPTTTIFFLDPAAIVLDVRRPRKCSLDRGDGQVETMRNYNIELCKLEIIWEANHRSRDSTGNMVKTGRRNY